jgi:hypothetical protein
MGPRGARHQSSARPIAISLGDVRTNSRDRHREYTTGNPAPVSERPDFLLMDEPRHNIPPSLPLAVVGDTAGRFAKSLKWGFRSDWRRRTLLPPATVRSEVRQTMGISRAVD